MFDSYLITGGLGSLGCALVARIFEQTSANITVIDNLSGKSDIGQLPSSVRSSARFQLVRGDTANEQLVHDTIEQYKVTCIIDCSCRSSISIERSPLKGARNAIEGITHILDAIRASGRVKSVVLVSSTAVYGSSTAPESRPLAPVSFRGAALMGAEAMLHSYYVSYRFPSAIVRLGEVAEKTFQAIVKDNHAPFPSSLISLSEAARAILLATEKADRAQVWNVEGNRYDAEEIRKALSSGPAPIPSHGGPIHCEKVKGELGFEPENDIHKAIPREDDIIASPSRPVKFLIYGANGWIGQQFVALLQERGVAWQAASKRPGTDNDDVIMSEIVGVAPTNVVTMVGRTHGEGCNSITYLEGGADKLRVNVRDNLMAPWVVASLCERLGVHHTYLGTGCLFKYDDEHTVGGKAYTEEDVSNFDGNSYSAVKGTTDRLLRHFERTLQARIRLPVNYEKDSRNLVSKMTSFTQVLDLPNSITILPDCLPILLDMALKRETGVINLVSPGPISFADIAQIYKEKVNKEHKYDVVLPDPSSNLVLSRSHCSLSSDRLVTLYPHTLSAREGVERAIEKMFS